jgi:hypothetical protein
LDQSDRWTRRTKNDRARTRTHYTLLSLALVNGHSRAFDVPLLGY